MKSSHSIALILTILAQLAWPLYMALQSEQVLREGQVYHFKTRPVDPADPFRGRYVALEFEADQVEVYGEPAWQEGQKLYAYLLTDGQGFAYITHLDEYPPGEEDALRYLEVELRYLHEGEPGTAHIRLPFDRYYMEESKAPIAEANYAKALSDGVVVYAVVRVRQGKGVLDALIAGEGPIEEY
jgi:uncharacterized membrane-anchored protein